jgi:predicted kinase
MLILVCGLPGSGKSFFARTLSKQLQARYYNSDLLRKELFPNKRTYSEEEKQTVYSSLVAIAEKDLKDQHTVIIDATFYEDALRISFYQLAEKLSCKLYIFHIQANEDLIKERTSLVREDSEADFNVYLKLKNKFEPIDRAFLLLNSERNNIDQLIHSALVYIKS